MTVMCVYHHIIYFEGAIYHKYETTRVTMGFFMSKINHGRSTYVWRVWATFVVNSLQQQKQQQ